MVDLALFHQDWVDGRLVLCHLGQLPTDRAPRTHHLALFSTGHTSPASFFFSTLGYYGTLILYAVPPTFALLHMLLPETQGGMGAGREARQDRAAR